MNEKEQRLRDLLTDAYNGLGSYRAVADACDNVVSHGMIRKVVEEGAWSPTLARHFGLKRKRYRLAADLETDKRRKEFRRYLDGESFTDWVFRK